MTRVDLIELLAQQKVVHPTTISALELNEESLRVSVTGYAWWHGLLDYNEKQKITFFFVGVRQGLLQMPMVDLQNDEALGYFSITPTSELPWAQPCTYEIYGNAPLGNALGLHAIVSDYLHATEAVRNAGDFLNACTSLSQFTNITSHRSYLVARGPEVIRQIVCDELERQTVPYTVLPTTGSPMGRFLVRIDNSSFICDEAFAEFD